MLTSSLKKTIASGLIEYVHMPLEKVWSWMPTGHADSHGYGADGQYLEVFYILKLD